MQKMIEKCLYLFFIALFFMNISVVLAAPQEISAEGEYRLGDTDTRDKAKKMALADAKRKIVEQAGIFVESYTEINNFKMTKDQIKSAASAMIKVKEERVEFYENGTICKAFIIAVVDTDNIGTLLKNLNKTEEKPKAQPKTQTQINGNTILIDFKNGIPNGFESSHGWTNGDPFNVNWYSDNITFKNGLMQLIIDKDTTKKNNVPYSGGEFRSKNFYGYGHYEVRMKSIKNNGTATDFLTYTGPSDGNQWDSICITILGKDPTKIQFNYFTNGQGNHEFIYNLGFDASKDFHNYAFEWYKDKIIWFVDGKEVHRVTKYIPLTKGKVFAKVWTGKSSIENWLGHLNSKNLPLQAECEWIKITEFE